MTTLTQSELESYLWEAAVQLRGLVDAGDYKQYVFPLLFYKRLSDVWDEDYSDAMHESDGDTAYAQSTANDRFVIPQGAHWADVRAMAKDLGRALQNAMRAI
jgi:type I restriction enzyme M protein